MLLNIIIIIMGNNSRYFQVYHKCCRTCVFWASICAVFFSEISCSKHLAKFYYLHLNLYIKPEISPLLGLVKSTVQNYKLLVLSSKCVVSGNYESAPFCVTTDMVVSDNSNLPICHCGIFIKWWAFGLLFHWTQVKMKKCLYNSETTKKVREGFHIHENHWRKGPYAWTSCCMWAPSFIIMCWI